jgi:hypothetical protein
MNLRTREDRQFRAARRKPCPIDHPYPAQRGALRSGERPGTGEYATGLARALPTRVKFLTKLRNGYDEGFRWVFRSCQSEQLAQHLVETGRAKAVGGARELGLIVLR